MMLRLSWLAVSLVLLAGWMAGVAEGQGNKKKGGQKYRTSPVGYSDTEIIPGQKWRVHDIDRPHPKMVTPSAKPGGPPSDAVVLFDGHDLSRWETRGKRDNAGKVFPARWIVKDGYFEVGRGTGDLATKEKFGDCQLHIEWASPAVIDGDSQWRGNSGILLMGRYEIQVLDSFNNKTYADGQAGAIYGQFPPLVNASRPTAEWQTYDIIFRAPRFANGAVAERARVTVIHNGVLLHHDQELIGPMAHKVVRKYEPHAAEEPLMLQDHDTSVRYRNVWIRRLGGYDQP
ncbi:MAG: DUF1080 domain-containing protein [Bryobacteraceae bacterium]